MSKVLRDFVMSWFAAASSESAFEREVDAAMVSMAAEIKRRAGRVDKKVSGPASDVSGTPGQKGPPPTSSRGSRS